MIKILRISTTKLSSYGRISYQLNYLPNVLTGDTHYNGIRCVPYRCKSDSDSVNNRVLEARSKLKNQSQKSQCNPNLPSSPKLMTCPGSKRPADCHPKKKDSSAPKNTQVLQARDCKKQNLSPCVSPSAQGTQGGSGTSGSTGGKSSLSSTSSTSSSSLKSKLPWILLLAGIGGGLIYYLLRSDSCDDDDGSGSGSKGRNGKKKGKNNQKSGQNSSGATPVLLGLRVPASSNDIPKYVPYLLIGGGTASFSAFRAIKSHDPTAKVMVISNEFHKPYMRPPLSKELWYNAEKNVEPEDDFRFKQWNGASRSLFYEPEQFYVNPVKLMETQNGGVAVCHGYTVKKILPHEQKAILSDGTEIKYDKCLIATGCTPKTLDVISSASQKVKEKVSVFRNPNDFICLKAIADQSQSLTIIGSGFLGSELACALGKYGKDRKLKVYQVFHENGNMAKVLPEYLSNWTTKNVEKQGVSVVPSVQVTSVERSHEKLKLSLSNGKTILTDHIIVCTGCEANTDIAKLSGLEVDSKLGGFLVNAELEARKNLYVAGDAACFYDPLLGRRRVEHHDHSVVSGRLAGENMTGLQNPYIHQSMFWSDLGPELGYEGIGLIDSSLPTVGVFARMDSPKVPEERGTPPTEQTLKNVSFKAEKTLDENENNESISSSDNTNLSNSSDNQISVQKTQHSISDDYGRGVIFYLKDNKVVGILLWNIFNRIGLARQIINENKSYDDLNEVAKLFEIHS